MSVKYYKRNIEDVFNNDKPVAVFFKSYESTYFIYNSKAGRWQPWGQAYGYIKDKETFEISKEELFLEML